MTVYPNPAKNVITVEMEMTEEKGIELLLIDLHGRPVRSESKNAKPGKNTFTLGLDQQHITSGIYFIQLKDALTKQLLSTKKIILE